MKRYLFLLLLFSSSVCNSQELRTDISLNDGWKTVADDNSMNAYSGFEAADYNDKSWLNIDVPHNWDDYNGYRTLKHGNRHGYAWYRRVFTVPAEMRGKQIFIWFEGVSSYATVWVNGIKAGYHAGGRTSFFIDITNLVTTGNACVLAIRADHPANIQDLPWVCGGCSPEYGFSEGSQPMGIFRPVHLIATSPVRIQPFGVHIWNDDKISPKTALLNIETEIKNYRNSTSSLKLISRLTNHYGKIIAETQSSVNFTGGTEQTIHQQIKVTSPNLWSPDNPYLYNLVSEIYQGTKVIDRITTPYGIRWIKWSTTSEPEGQQLLINGKPYFLNGTAEYEHLLGQSHAFSNEQIDTRVKMFRAAGYNAFRDAHQPHNLRYHANWDSLGILWWPQFAAHIWYDTPEFRNNFKNLLKDWIRERRNSPSIILWGLENESSLPQSFAEECSAIIRQMDPTASSQRKITTCNNGKGTDWDVPQNWTGTYGGTPVKYAEEIQKQKLVGEYGAWRNLGYHTENADLKGTHSEEQMTQMMELKIHLADSVKNKIYGHFHWLLSSHDNPGRFQNGEGYRYIDRIGPVNFKALFTSWDEPTDAFYMYRSNFVSKTKEPMVYIVSHTWPDRWTVPGIKNDITVYSNCDEVELFNDIQSESLGIRKRGGIGTHFEWDSVPVRYNVLYAEGRVDGKVVARDYIVLHHLPKAPNLATMMFNRTLNPKKSTDILSGDMKELHYIYRVNCGGPEYTDHLGNHWDSDVTHIQPGTWGSHSWADTCSTLPDAFASQRSTADFITGTTDQELFRSFRFGRHRLSYEFPLPDGQYRVELFFAEPWYGTGGSLNCKGWRLFDIALNDSVVLKDLDIWNEVGHDHVLKKVINITVRNGKLAISFPKVKSGQAIISAITIASTDKNRKAAPASHLLIQGLTGSPNCSVQRWLDTGQKVYSNDSVLFSKLPAELYTNEWIRSSLIKGALSSVSFRISKNAEVYVPIVDTLYKPDGLKNWNISKKHLETNQNGGTRMYMLQKSFNAGDTIKLTTSDPIIVHHKNILEMPIPVSRPSATYEIEDATMFGPSIDSLHADFSGKGYAQCSNSTDTVEWKIAVGVGDTYSLRFRYMNLSDKDIVGVVSVIDKDDNVLNSGTVYFSPSGQIWDKVITTTGTNINAGSYRIRVIIKNAKGLLLDNLKVQ
jgi:hypothetical protein